MGKSQVGGATKKQTSAELNLLPRTYLILQNDLSTANCVKRRQPAVYCMKSSIQIHTGNCKKSKFQISNQYPDLHCVNWRQSKLNLCHKLCWLIVTIVPRHEIVRCDVTKCISVTSNLLPSHPSLRKVAKSTQAWKSRQTAPNSDEFISPCQSNCLKTVRVPKLKIHRSLCLMDPNCINLLQSKTIESYHSVQVVTLKSGPSALRSNRNLITLPNQEIVKKWSESHSSKTRSIHIYTGEETRAPNLKVNLHWIVKSSTQNWSTKAPNWVPNFTIQNLHRKLKKIDKYLYPS